MKAKVPVVFAETLVADFLINLGTPFIVGAAGIVYVVFSERTRPVPWYGWPLLAALALACVGIPFGILYQAGGWLLVTSTALFFSHAGWFFHRRKDARGAARLFIRGLFGPWLFMVPALLLSCLYVGRNDLGFDNTDWVPLFGMIYFGIQAGFEEFMLRNSGDKAPSSLPVK
ncbi:MAG: hypothetical protein QME74_00750 [Candidatus Edwardsbacteria bacterium]|nr:hypothetical protein [Candidatus Edwardsbacteria bacterium]